MKLSIFTSTTSDGIMSNNKKYYPKLSKEEIEKVYNLNLSRFLSKYNLKVEDAVIMNDSNTKISSHTVTTNNKKYKDRILVLKESTKNIPILVETSDDPIIVAYATDDNNKQIAVIGKASIDNLNNDLIHDMTEILMKESNKATFEMKFYIGPCPSKENYIIDENLELDEKVFKKAVEKIDDKIHLDLRYAIFNQLYLEIVAPEEIYFDSNDTVEDKKYYSDLANKVGRHISCVVFTEE
ncbi:MAG: laccase domain-containing protein [Bacilli bacterium]|nr:laccase domain-containing protein [Bacilli bacterium]